MTGTALPGGLAMVAVDDIHPCPLQPRVTVSIELVRKLAESMRAGRHDPLLEVEPAPNRPGHYEIVCGEQRWRAAKEAGLGQVLVRVHHRLGYLERLQKQSEENHLRGDLTPAEEADLVFMAKALRDIAAAEQLLIEAGVAFKALEVKHVTARVQVFEHLDSLKAQLLENKINVVRTAAGAAIGPLSPWRDTEKALGISESTRKAKLAILRLESDVLEETQGLPFHHVSLIAQVSDHRRRSDLVERAPHLTNRQLHGVVKRLRHDPELSVEHAVGGRPLVERSDPLAFEVQLEHLCDLCRQIARLLNNIRSRVSSDEKQQLVAVVGELRATLDGFEAAA